METEFLDSLRAVEKWYFAPQKVRGIASFSNLRRRLRDGETTIYYDNGSVKRRTTYRAGDAQEESAYYPNGKLRRHRIFGKEAVAESKCFDEHGTPLNCDTLAWQIKCPPRPATPSEYMSIRYPTKALKLGIEGEVRVEFMVDRFGRLVDVWVVESPSVLLNEEAIAAIKRVKKWYNVIVDCEPIDTLFTLPVTFHIE
ncbi:TonB family protein [Hymenobacter caeli]|uniref:TonB family protein n=1 Tax=Hymenobacter caeli TaxID=2735894 RepID=A0ABX2FV21_9BACT|nr:energy transducer TonB [Hymenobacter caeli]NRT21040.1 TonB family protein [Hymenobacter caeli]